MRITEVCSWTEEWIDRYIVEEVNLKNIFREELLSIDHIGSTSIPTIGFAKPIIDILIVLRDIEKVDDYYNRMLQYGYYPRGENGISGRRYFTKGIEKRTHHIHIYQEGNENIKKHLVFKEYLLKHPEDAKAYGQLKIKLAQQFPENHPQYQEGKGAFVNKLLEKAIAWHNSTTSTGK